VTAPACFSCHSGNQTMWGIQSKHRGNGSGIAGVQEWHGAMWHVGHLATKAATPPFGHQSATLNWNAQCVFAIENKNTNSEQMGHRHLPLSNSNGCFCLPAAFAFAFAPHLTDCQLHNGLRWHIQPGTEFAAAVPVTAPVAEFQIPPYNRIDVRPQSQWVGITHALTELNDP